MSDDDSYDDITILSDELSCINLEAKASPYPKQAILKQGEEFDLRMMTSPLVEASDLVSDKHHRKLPVFCQIMSEETKKVRADIKQEFGNYDKQSPRLPVTKALVGGACVALYEGKYYRGIIEKVGGGKYPLTIFFMDTGDHSPYSIEKGVFEISEALLQFPPQAYTIHLESKFNKRLSSKCIRVKINRSDVAQSALSPYGAKFVKDLGENVICDIGGLKIEPFRLPQLYKIDYTALSRFEVIVTDANKIDSIWFRQWANNESYSILQDFLKRNLPHYPNLEQLNFQEGSLCLVVINLVVHRGRIEDTLGQNADVRLIDLGEIKQVTKAQLMEIPPILLKYPAFATRGELYKRHDTHLPAIQAALKNSEPIFVRILKPSRRNKPLLFRVSSKCEEVLLKPSEGLRAALPRSRSRSKTPTRSRCNAVGGGLQLRKKNADKEQTTTEQSKPDLQPLRTVIDHLPPPPPLPRKIEAVLAHANSFSDFYIQPMQNQNDLLKLPEVMLKTYGQGDCLNPQAPPVEVLAPKQICCAKWSEDGLFYRAEIIHCSDREKYQVRFIDFGNVTEVLPNDLKQMHPTLLRKPPLCYHARVHPSQEAEFAEFREVGKLKVEVVEKETDTDYYRVRFF